MMLTGCARWQRQEKKTPLPSKIMTLDHGGIQPAVEAAMHTLSLRFLDEDIISTRAEKYVSLFFNYCLAAHTQPITKTEFEQHPSKIKDQSAALLLTLRTMRGPVAEALNSHRPTTMGPVGFPLAPPTLGEMESYLQWLNEAASLVKAPSTAKAHKGPGRLLHERKIANAAACDFFALTGKHPTRSVNKGGFVDFLRMIFAALNIKSNIDDRAREAVDSWKAREAERQHGLGE
jgi:hypothetical protein